MSPSHETTKARSRWWWAAWIILGIAFGVQAIRMQLAQASVREGNGARAALVRPQNGWGLGQLAEFQFEQGDARSALATSTKALRRTPLSTEAIRTLAQSRDKLGPSGAGESAWQVASMMGWRDKPTQLWAVLRALANGDTEVFAIRADALLRRRDPQRQMTPIVRQAMVERSIRGAFLKRIETQPPWRSRLFYSGRVMTGNELDGTILLLRDLARTPYPPKRDEVRDAIASLVALKRYPEALALDRLLVRRSLDPGSMVGDGGFEMKNTDYRTSVTPFDWNISPEAASLDQSGGRRSVAVTFDGDRRRIPVMRHVALRPGRYIAEFAMKGSPESGASLGMQVFCAPTRASLGNSAARTLRAREWEKRAFHFNVPADCPMVLLTLGALPQAEPGEALFDDVSIRPAA